MSYVLVTDDTIQSIGGLPRSARRLDNDAWVMGLANASTEAQQACGWYEVADTDRPDDTATTTFDRSIELVEGVPTVVWTERDKTDDELNPPESIEEQLAAVTAALEALAGGGE